MATRSTGPASGATIPTAGARCVRSSAPASPTLREWAAVSRTPAPVDPNAVLPRPRGAGPRALARARRLRASRCAAARAPSRGSSTRARRPPTAARARTTSSPASSRTSSRASRRCAATTSSARAAGTATACRSRSRSSRSSASPRKDEIEALRHRRVQRRSAASRSSTYLEDWNALTERIGFWVDLDDAYRTLDATYIESVWWALRQIWDKGLLYEGHKVVPVLPALRHRAVEPRGRAGLRGRRRPVASTCASRSSRTAGPLQAGDELLVWTTTPWTLVSNAAVAVDPELTYVRARGRRRRARARRRRGARRARARRGRRDRSTASPARELAGARYEPPFPFLPRRDLRRRAATPSCPPTSSPPTTAPGLVHTAIAFGEDDFRLGAAVRPDRRQPGAARRHLRRAHRPVRGPLRQGRRRRPHRGPARARAAAARRGLRARLPALLALRHAAPLLRQAVLVHRDRRSCATACSPPTSQVDWHPEHIKHGRFGDWLREQRRLGAVARALLGHAAAGVALRERPRALRRLVRRARGAQRRAARGPAPAVRRRGRLPVPAVRRARWRACPRSSTSGSTRAAMPFAQWHAPFENEEHFERALPGRLHLRGDRPDARLVLLAARRLDAAVRPRALPRTSSASACILDERGPEDVASRKGNIVVPVGRARPLRRRRVPLVLLHVQAAVGRLPLLARGDRRGRAPVPAAALEHVRVLRRCTRTPPRCEGGDADAGRATELDRWILSRLAATVEEVTERLDDFDATIAGRAIAAFVDDLSNWYVRRSRRRFWDGDPAAFATLRECLRDDGAAARAVHARSSPTRSTTTSTATRAVGAPDRLARSPARATSALEVAMATARETVAPRARPRAGRRRSRSASRCARRSSSPPAASARRSSASPTSCARSSTSRRCASSRRPTSSARYEVKPNYRTLGPRFGKQMPQVAAAVAALDPAHVAAALREGRTVGVAVDGHDHQLGADDLLLAMQPLEGYQLEREGSHAVALDLRARRRAAPRGPGARGRPRRAERAQGARASRSRTGSR